MPITQNRVIALLEEHDALLAWHDALRSDLYAALEGPMTPAAKLDAIQHLLDTAIAPIGPAYARERAHFAKHRISNAQRARKMARLRKLENEHGLE